ncbi:mevalonate kinase [Lactobacillus sp. PV037]|uniref:mevalonate kinase n=1 Tax=Lactobacillus sp. PV037 TaxID=2594496 RepID=UPI00223F9C1D|nr:mevalonate kinase [Lactobacillus sp. PV037]QNQ83580.1 mevalonate kinase [Lactobacillus sp. PV037]
MNKTTITSHGKVILIGEHSVVYGKNAFAMPIKALQIKTTIEPLAVGNSQMITKNYHGDFLSAPATYDGLKYIYKTLTSRLSSPPTLKITYEGEIPIERGLGSSAVVALGTTKALNEFLNLNLSKKEIMKIANHAEMINHGKASGLDTATVNSDYLVSFSKATGPTALKSHLGASLLIMDSGQLGNTRQAVELVRKQLETTQDGKKRINQLGSLANDFKKAWLSKDIFKIGDIFNQAQTILASFHLSTSKIDQIIEVANANGALGTKISGGGLGGIVIALCPTKEIAQQIIGKVKSNIVNYWIEEI